MKRDWFNINMYIYSVVLFIQVFVKMCISAGKLSGIVNKWFCTVCKGYFLFFSSGN